MFPVLKDIKLGGAASGLLEHKFNINTDLVSSAKLELQRYSRYRVKKVEIFLHPCVDTVGNNAVTTTTTPPTGFVNIPVKTPIMCLFQRNPETDFSGTTGVARVIVNPRTKFIDPCKQIYFKRNIYPMLDIANNLTVGFGKNLISTNDLNVDWGRFIMAFSKYTPDAGDVNLVPFDYRCRLTIKYHIELRNLNLTNLFL